MRKIVWKGLLYKSWENCRIEKKNDAFYVESTIIGNYMNRVYNVNYILKIDKNWCIQEFEIKTEIDGQGNVVVGTKSEGQWSINGMLRAEFNEFLYIDISVTPFTNTLPINNLLLNIGQSAYIDVVYINILENEIKPAKQLYSRKKKDEYLYDNLDTEFSSSITVDQKGIVKSYPGLFELVLEGREN
ncbi:putative glycolipid-binding domain-containing protein [Chryseobacterium phocaeense]|uniref:putative glycolipid-binding domain-containing protein n=1 Tax=Chryseobacterium phocaeense TaxID=1816690 RepID=UPI00111AB894|nr:putative glycolipid-binding domain-containing protein [Chryseobacterium phocaeense]